jgi:hypothetical protein
VTDVHPASFSVVCGYILHWHTYLSGTLFLMLQIIMPQAGQELAGGLIKIE